MIMMAGFELPIKAMRTQIASGEIPPGEKLNLDELRQVVRNSFEVVTYVPKTSEAWGAALRKFNGLKKA